VDCPWYGETSAWAAQKAIESGLPFSYSHPKPSGMVRSIPMTDDDDMKAELERLRAENEALKRTSSKGLSLRISEKGGVSIYGLGRFPVTLYKEQWLRLLDMADDIRMFIQANEAHLKSKEQLQPPTA
jgi:hypothetical protein